MTNTLKVGVIGVGGIAHSHMEGWSASPLAEVVAGCDVNQALLESWGAKFGVSHLTATAGELINDPDLDIIDICTPNNFHAPLAIAAMQAGKHVICEKPLAPTPDEIRQMIAARDASGKLLMTAQHHRFSGSAKALKAEIDAGALGEVYHARAWYLRRAAVPLRPGFILKEQASGGATIDVGVHILDLTLWMMGNPPPVAVTGVARTELAHREGAFSVWGGAIPSIMDVEEFAAAFVRFANGATLMLETSWLLHHNTDDDDIQMWLYGTAGGSHWPRCEIYQTDNVRRQLYNRQLKLIQDSLPPRAQEMVEFAEAVAAGGPSPVPAEDSLQVQMILDAVYRSQVTGREVRLDEA